MKKICHREIGKIGKRFKWKHLMMLVEVEMGTISENNEENFYVIMEI